jgi:hypothetical protein
MTRQGLERERSVTSVVDGPVSTGMQRRRAGNDDEGADDAGEDRTRDDVDPLEA